MSNENFLGWDGEHGGKNRRECLQIGILRHFPCPMLMHTIHLVQELLGRKVQMIRRDQRERRPLMLLLERRSGAPAVEVAVAAALDVVFGQQV